jgi:hypothetical protein
VLRMPMRLTVISGTRRRAGPGAGPGGPPWAPGPGIDGYPAAGVPMTGRVTVALRLAAA